MTNLCIYASELAVITGHNQYKDVGEIILKMWKKNFPEDYEAIIKEAGVVVESTDEVISRISKENNINIKEKMKTCLVSNDVTAMTKVKKEILKKFDTIPEKDKKLVQSCIAEKTNTNFGTNHENAGVAKYMEEYEDNVNTVDTFFKRHMFKSEYDWFVGGKIDGINDEKVLIEVKNRMNRLFYKLRDYEKVQIYAYMFILELDDARLVECFKRRNQCTINVIDVPFEQSYWDTEISTKIEEFIVTFESFLKNKQQKLDLVNILFSS
tara:strand:+ start:154 stop:954 length:801 start_codon:yes stop_codon:yes gene_type:complete